MGIGRPATDEMVEGYVDGLDLDSPEPSANRSRSYRHGFANGRDDRRGKPRASADFIRRQADEAMISDEAQRNHHD
jgi:hypothetical protein